VHNGTESESESIGATASNNNRLVSPEVKDGDQSLESPKAPFSHKKGKREQSSRVSKPETPRGGMQNAAQPQCHQ